MAEIDLNKIKNNSDSAKRHELKSEPEHLMKKPPGLFARFISRFAFGSFEEAGQAVIEEVVIPTLLDGLRDSIYTATDYILYNGTRGGGRSSKRGGYTSYGKKGQQRSARKTSPAAGAYYFTFDTRDEAQKVLDQMRDVVEQRDFVTIMEMFAIAKRQTNNYTYTDWGWPDLSRAMVRRTTDGRYYIDLPKPVPEEE